MPLQPFGPNGNSPLQPFGLNAQPTLYHEAFVQYTDPSQLTGTVVFDAVLSEDWTEPATVTEHPVEKGANVTDHVRVEAARCTLKVRVSNEPIGSNQFADPLGGAEQLSPLVLEIPTPNQTEFDGVIDVPHWKSNQDIAIQVGIIANLIGQQAEKIIGEVLPGDATAKALKPEIQATQTGNDVIAYPPPIDIPLSGKPVQTLEDDAGAAIYHAITSLVPPGEEIDVPTITDAGLASAAPIPPAQAMTVQFAQSGMYDFAAQMIDLLVRLKDSAAIFTVYGSKQTMASMVIETLSPHRGATEDTGTGADITIGFKQVRIVTTQTVNAPLPKLPRAQTPQNMGAQDPTPTDPKKMKSVAVKIFSGGANLVSSGPLP